MAKKITFQTVSDYENAKGVLRNSKIDFVDVRYPKHGETPARNYIVVRNVMKTKALPLLKGVMHVKSVRHFESIAAKHDFYQPTFQCTCRNCKKTFNSHVKEAAWCSAKCKKDFRNKKKAV